MAEDQVLRGDLAGATPQVRSGSLIRSLVPLGYVVTVVGLVTSFVSPFLPLYLSGDLRAAPGLVSLFLFAMPLAAVGVASVVGRVSDRPGMRYRVLILAALAGCAGFLLFAVVRQYWAALAVAMILLAAATALMPQVFAFSRALLDRTHPSRAATGISWLRSLLSLAWVAGPPLAAYLIGTIDFRGLFIVVAVMHLAVLPVLMRFGRAATADPPVANGDDSTAPAASGPTRGQLVLTSTAFVLLQSAGTLGVMSMSLFVSVDLHGDVGEAGVILGVCAGLEIPLMVLFGALAHRWPLHRLVLLGGTIGVAYFLTMSLTSAVWHAIVAQALNACFIAAVTGLGISYFQDLMPGRLGRATTMFTNTYRLSAMLAGLLIGVVQVAGYRFSYVTGAGLCSAGLLLLALTRPAPRPGQARLEAGVNL